MRKFVKRTVTVVLAFVLALCSSVVWHAASASDVQKQIDQLKREAERLEQQIANAKKNKTDEELNLSLIQKKIANTQEQIRRYNQEISRINTAIDQNNQEIAAKNAEIEESKLTFKKRIRAIYMSNTESSLQVLIGAESFSDYLQLSQLLSAVSSHDKAMIEKIVAAVDELNKRQKENEDLLSQQVAAKNQIVAIQNQLQAEEAEAKNLQKMENQLANTEKSIKDKQDYLNSLKTSNIPPFINPSSGFMWPVAGYYNITSGYGARWGTIHRGIDISSAGIFGKPIVAIADGYVYRTYNSCPHKTVSSRCSCGSGFGNHVGVDHGTMKINGSSAEYKAIYAHMDSIAVSDGQYVKQGQVIGYVGTTGDSTGYHLHFGLIKNGSYVDPYPYFFS